MRPTVAWLVVSLLLAGCGGSGPGPSPLPSPAAVATPTVPSQAALRPCDLFSTATPCAAAFSTTRALYAAYLGPLYAVTRASDGAKTDVGLLPDGFANAAPADAFCANTTCVISKVYDQSPDRNDLTVAPPGSNATGAGPGGYDLPAVANALPILAGGHALYGIATVPGMGYRDDATVGMPIGQQPQGVYMVTASVQVNSSCCFDFGNAEPSNTDTGAGSMDAINVICRDGSPCGDEAGLDLENGIYGGLAVPMGLPFVTDMGENDGVATYTIWQGNAQAGGLTTTGPLALGSRYKPMHPQGAIILGIGGDNSDRAYGHFFEGAITRGTPTAAVMADVQRNVVAAAYQM